MKIFLVSFIALLAPIALAQEINLEQKKRLVDKLRNEISSRYVMELETQKIIDTLNETQNSEKFKSSSEPDEIAEILNQTLQKHDKHFAVRWRDPAISNPRIANEDWFSKLDRKNSGFQRTEILDGNIGYIDFWGFDLINERSKKRAETTMDFISGTDAIIFDLRSNGGGSADMVRFISSYLFEDSVHLNSIYWKESDSTSEFWTYPNVNGKKRTETPVYILTSSDTFSAAEEFAYNLKSRKRATIVGESTKGGANPWKFFDLPLNFKVAIPIAKAINPVTNDNWEGVGVQPDIKSSKESAFGVAYKLALENLQKSTSLVPQKKEIERALLDLDT